jgi:primosomal protein N' (replication factor Y)
VPALSGRRFDYSVPERWLDDVAVGTRVRIRLHGRAIGGWVREVGVTPPGGVVLQPLSGMSGLGPPAGVCELAEWAAWRWAGPVSSFLRTASPERNVRGLPAPPRPAGPPAGAPGGAGPVRLSEVAPGRPAVYRVAPAEDLLPLVLSVIAQAGPGTVLVLVPSVGWAARLSERLARRGVAVAGNWAEVAAGWPVAVGSRAASWWPVASLAAAVVLDAHDEAYREERAPTFSAVDVVAERAARQGAPCVLVSPCPTASQVALGPVRAPASPDERAGWPAVAVADRRGADPRTGILSDELVRLARRVLAEGTGPLVCVLQRLGRARLLACAACGGVARCEACGRAVHEDGGALACPGCGAARPVVCALCGATRLKVLRQGVAKVREELAALLGVAVAEVTATSADPGPADAVLVGTEAVLHRVRRAGAVVFLDFDQHLLAPRFAAADEALALVARAGRLVGGRRPGTGRPGGLVLLQTRMPEHEVVLAAVSGDPGPVTEGELALRRRLSLPPAAALAVVSGDAAAAYAGQLGEVAGVAVAELAADRWLVRAPDHRVLCDALAGAARPAGRLRVAVDPTDV